MSLILPSVHVFYDRNGAALEDGYVYIGEAGQDAQANPIQVYSDPDMIVPVAQPIRTLGGYPVYQGAPMALYIDAPDCSITVLDEFQRDVLVNAANALTAEALTFLQAGNDAVPRSAQGKMRDIVSAKDFGAVGDGATDDTTAIQNAIDYLASVGGGTLWFPFGVYVVHGLQGKAGVELLGSTAGRSQGVVFKDETANGVTLTWASAETSGTVTGIYFFGPGDGSTSTSIGMVIEADDINVNYCTFRWYNDQAIRIDNSSVGCSLTRVFALNVCLNYARTSRVGALDVSGTDHFVYACQFGCSQNLINARTSANLYNCGIYFRTGSNSWVMASSGENCDIGICIDGGATSQYNRFTACRGDQCWGHSLLNAGNHNLFASYFAQNVSLHATGAYSAIKTTGADNLYFGCKGEAVARFPVSAPVAKIPSYGYEDTLAASQIDSRNVYIGCTGPYNTSLFLMTEFVGSAAMMPPLALRTTDAEPDANRTDFLVLVHSSNTDLTDFLGSYSGKEITLLNLSASTITLKQNANIQTNTGADVVLVQNNLYKLTYYNGKWYQL